VWPWNLAMISLALALFPITTQPKGESPNLSGSWKALRKSKPAMAIILPFALLPILSYFGKWDSYFSFALYSESNATANIFVTQRFVDRLPEKLRTYVIEFPNFDPQVQGPFIFNPGPWAYEEMHVPPISEPRAFRSVFNALRVYAPEPEDLRLVVGERGGRVMFYQGDTAWPLQAR
jgi:hypothetical protein